MRNNKKKIENETVEGEMRIRVWKMMEEWWKMGKSGKDERLFEEKRKNLKHKKGNRIYTIYGGNYKRKSNPNLYINTIFMSVIG